MGEEMMDLYFCICWGITTITIATIYLVIACFRFNSIGLAHGDDQLFHWQPGGGCAVGH